ncbi:hypothetical protein ABZY19_29225 [Streptomyces sp. NPDC006475]|uniref:ATP-dependent DNA ligase n=1 Tax=Streptomyces sp. NPDC006475 TaxID=3155719 RepID=UPI0033A535CD
MMFEPEYDGYRLLGFAHDAKIFLPSRNLRKLTDAFPEITSAAAALGDDVVLDGEVVILTLSNCGSKERAGCSRWLPRRYRGSMQGPGRHPPHALPLPRAERPDNNYGERSDGYHRDSHANHGARAHR